MWARTQMQGELIQAIGQPAHRAESFHVTLHAKRQRRRLTRTQSCPLSEGNDLIANAALQWAQTHATNAVQNADKATTNPSNAVDISPPTAKGQRATASAIPQHPPLARSVSYQHAPTGIAEPPRPTPVDCSPIEPAEGAIDTAKAAEVLSRYGVVSGVHAIPVQTELPSTTVSQMISAAEVAPSTAEAGLLLQRAAVHATDRNRSAVNMAHSQLQQRLAATDEAARASESTLAVVTGDSAKTQDSAVKFTGNLLITPSEYSRSDEATTPTPRHMKQYAEEAEAEAADNRLAMASGEATAATVVANASMRLHVPLKMKTPPRKPASTAVHRPQDAVCSMPTQQRPAASTVVVADADAAPVQFTTPTRHPRGPQHLLPKKYFDPSKSPSPPPAYVSPVTPRAQDEDTPSEPKPAPEDEGYRGAVRHWLSEDSISPRRYSAHTAKRLAASMRRYHTADATMPETSFSTTPSRSTHARDTSARSTLSPSAVASQLTRLSSLLEFQRAMNNIPDARAAAQLDSLAHESLSVSPSPVSISRSRQASQSSPSSTANSLAKRNASESKEAGASDEPDFEHVNLYTTHPTKSELHKQRETLFTMLDEEISRASASISPSHAALALAERTEVPAYTMQLQKWNEVSQEPKPLPVMQKSLDAEPASNPPSGTRLPASSPSLKAATSEQEVMEAMMNIKRVQEYYSDLSYAMHKLATVKGAPRLKGLDATESLRCRVLLGILTDSRWTPPEIFATVVSIM